MPAQTLGDLRDRVRSQTQTTDSELPNSDVDSWLQEAYDRTVAATNDWPFFEHTWNLTLTAGESEIDEPTDYMIQQVISFVDTTENIQMELVHQEWAEKFYSRLIQSVGVAVHYSLWDGKIIFWPTPAYDDDRVYRMRGYRRPIDWIALGAAQKVDADYRLHLPLAHYATALAYEQQEDMEMSRFYMERWQKDAQAAADSILDPVSNRPMQIGPRYITPIGHRW